MSQPDAQSPPTPSPRGALILGGVEALPTLSPVAVRLLEVGGREDADLSEVIPLIESDPAMAAKILALCRRAERGLGDRITTVRRAVVMLGWQAVQSAVLSVAVYDALRGHWRRGAGAEGAGIGFDHTGFWEHAIGVACAGELIAGAHPRASVAPEEAFVAGLLHDLGKLVLDYVLPRSYGRVLTLAESRRCPTAAAERDVLGIDHYAAGKRLAEHWSLPHALRDVMWLHGQPRAALPELPHVEVIGIVNAANALARELHLGWAGEFDRGPGLEAVCGWFGLDAAAVRSVTPRLHAHAAERCRVLGLAEPSSPELLLRSVTRANERLARLAATLEERCRVSERRGTALDALTVFHQDAAQAETVPAALARVCRSASSLFGEGAYRAVFQAGPGEPCVSCVVEGSGEASEPELLPCAAPGDSLAMVSDPSHLGAGAAAVAPWLVAACDPSGEASRVWRLIPLAPAPGRVGPACVLLHDRDLPTDPASRAMMRSLAGAWGAAVCAAAEREESRRLAEHLAGATRTLAEAQELLVESQSMARLGELAAGAAHEMNNPLAVISGRSQMLLARAQDEAGRAAAAAITAAAEHLSTLVTSLHLFAHPPRPRPEPLPASELIRAGVEIAEERTGVRGRVRLIADAGAPRVWADRDLVGQALGELVVNALQSSPETTVEVRVERGRADDRPPGRGAGPGLRIIVKDNGRGMSPRTLQHAFDPFFSEKPAGRQTGLGLTRARRLIELHGGTLTLRSAEGAGAAATVWLPETEEPNSTAGDTAPGGARAA